MAFAELCARSCFSFLEGASQPEELVTRAHELELAALGIADRNGLYGMVRAHVEAERLGVPLRVGARLDVRVPLEAHPGGPTETLPLVLLVASAEGYEHLCSLLTLAHEGRPLYELTRETPRETETEALDDEPEPRAPGGAPTLADEPSVPLDAVLARAAGLVALVPAVAAPRPGEWEALSRLALRARAGLTLAASAREAFDRRVFVATHRHGEPDDARRDAFARQVEESLAVATIAQNAPLFHHKSRKPLADVLTCIREKTTLDRAGSALLGNAEATLVSAEQMRRRFHDHPEWVERTVDVADLARFSLSSVRYDFPGRTLAAPGETVDETLARLVDEGARRRYPSGTPPTVRAQLDKELALIGKLGVAPYFLSVHQIIEIARDKRILCQGRGSAANSAVCFVLGVTAVDPARSSLLFERFLSAERAEPPDIDVDFEHERREEVIQAIYEVYGRDRAAMVSEVICYRKKMAVREVAKAFGFSPEQVDRLAAAAPIHFASHESIPEKRVRELGLDPRDPRLQRALLLANVLEGFPRHLSIHVGGFVLSAEPLAKVAPVQPARMPGRTVIPWDKDDLEALGFFKVDVLGLGMLTCIRKALALLHRHAPSERAPPADPLEALASIPAEDPAVYDAISQADTIGVFQIESRAQMSMLPRLRPRTFYDLVIEVAIVRPGPIQGGMVHPYLRRRQGLEEARSPHPCLDPILERTLGVPLFQEQVMQIAMVGAGYSAGEADQLRRDMAAWKKTGRLARHRERLLQGFEARGISAEFGERLYQQIHGFGEYGFPESHAASFALLVYASAWLKTHHPAAFACALLNAQPMGFYSASSIVQDAQRHGVTVLAPCVLASEWDGTLDALEGPLRLGLRQIKGLGEAAGRAVVRARREAPFASIDDLAKRAGLKRNELEALAMAGALERLEPERRQALWQAREPRERDGLFAGVRVEGDAPPPPLPRMRPAEQLAFDYDRLGLSVSDHPLRHLRERLRERGVVTSSELSSLRHGRKVVVAGLVIGRQRPATASGVTFITLEDETGMVNLIVRLSTWEEQHAVASHATLLLARGKLEREGGSGRGAGKVIHVLVDTMERLDAGGLTVRSRDFH